MKFLKLLVFISVLCVGQLHEVCNTYLNTINSSISQYKYGDTVHFSCKVRNTTMIDGSNFFLLHESTKTKIPFTNITGETGFTDVKVVSLETGGDYSCRYNGCKIDSLTSIYNINVDKCSFPRKNSIRQMNCKVNDLYNMTCDWTVLPEDNDCTTWKVEYKSGQMEKFKCCTADGDQNCTSTSSRRQCYIPESDFYRFIPYNITLTETSEQGTNVYNYTVVPDNTIENVNIENNVQVTPGETPYDLVVGFTLHHPPSSVGGMKCSIIYKSEWKQYVAMISTYDISQSNLDVNIKLDNLTAFTRYTVNVCCRPIASPYWSNQVTGFGRTSPAVCDNVPRIIGYSYRPDGYFTETKLYLYLKKKIWYGNDTLYIISWESNHTRHDRSFPADTVTAELGSSESNHTRHDRSFPADTVTAELGSSESNYIRNNCSFLVDTVTAELVSPDSNHTKHNCTFLVDSVTSELEEIFMTNKSYLISVRTQNEVGVTNLSAHINIEMKDEQAKNPLTVVVEEAEGESQVLLYPNNDHDNDNDDDVTYYYCQGEPDFHPPICKTDLQNSSVSRFKVDKLKDTNRIWYYGVMVGRSETNSYNRIIWSDCVFNSKRMFKSKQLEVSASWLPSNSSIVKVSLPFDFCQLKNRPVLYQVGFWPANQKLSDYCQKNTSGLQNFTATPLLSELHVFVGELSNITLCFRVQYSDNHFDITDDITPGLKTGYFVSAAEKKMDRSKPIAIGIAVPCSLVFLLIIGISISIYRGRIKRFREKNEIRILGDSPSNISAQYDIWTVPDESSGTYSNCSSLPDERDNDENDQTNVKAFESHQGNSNEISDNHKPQLETNFPVPTNDVSNNDPDYLIPATTCMYHPNEELSFTGYERADYQTNTELSISAANSYLQALDHQRDSSQRGFGFENTNATSQNNTNFGYLSDEINESTTGQLACVSDNLSVGAYSRAAFLPAMNSATLSNDGYLVAQRQAVSNNIPSSLHISETGERQSQLTDSNGPSNNDEPFCELMTYRINDDSNSGLKSISEYHRAEAPHNSSSCTDGVLSNESDNLFTSDFNVAVSVPATETTVYSDTGSLDGYHKADNVDHTGKDDVMIRGSTKTEELAGRRGEEMSESAATIKMDDSDEAPESESTFDSISERSRIIGNEDVEMVEICFIHSSVHNSDASEGMDDRTGETQKDKNKHISLKDIRKAFENIGQALDGDEDNETECSFDSYAIADIEYQSNSNSDDDTAANLGYVANST